MNMLQGTDFSSLYVMARNAIGETALNPSYLTIFLLSHPLMQ